MNPEQFCYWLKGRAELVAEAPTDAEWKSIKEHLDLVFKKVTPLAPGDFMNDRQLALELENFNDSIIVEQNIEDGLIC